MTHNPDIRDDDRLTLETIDRALREAFGYSAEYRTALLDDWLAKHVRKAKGTGWEEGFTAGWEEAKDPGAFVNDVWDAKTPNPYTGES